MKRITTLLVTSIISLILLATACNPPPSRSLTVVTGKVVYGTLAMEGAELNISKMENGKWKMVDSSRSGYHGSFRLHLAEGTYRIEANTTMRSGDNILQFSGALEPLTVDGKKGRMDQLVIKLKAEN